MLRLNTAEEKAEADLSAAETEQRAAAQELQATAEELSAARAECVAARDKYMASFDRFEAAYQRAVKVGADVSAKAGAFIEAESEHINFARKLYERIKPRRRSAQD